VKGGLEFVDGLLEAVSSAEGFEKNVQAGI